jgi:hypothetical protein
VAQVDLDRQGRIWVHTVSSKKPARSFGFLDPLLYQLADTTALNDVLPLSSTTPAAYRGVWCEPKECAASRTQPGLGLFDVQIVLVDAHDDLLYAGDDAASLRRRRVRLRQRSVNMGQKPR